MTQGTRASFDDDYRGTDQVYTAEGGTKVAGGPAIPFSKTSNSLRNIFAGPEDVPRNAIPSGPATIAKTETANTQTTDTELGKFNSSPRSSTTDLESTQTLKTPELNAFERIAKVTSGFVKRVIDAIPGQSIDAAGNPIVTTDDDDDGGSSGQGQAPDGGYGTGYGGQSSTVGQMTTPSYTQEQDDYDSFEDLGVTPTTTVTPSYGGAGPRAQGGLIARPKRKVKKKTTNKRGLAARK